MQNPQECGGAGADRSRCHASHDGFDLHAGVRIPAGHPARLERLCRYTLRPPVAQDRLQLTADGQVLLQLRRRWSDGTTHLLFHPLELLERMAALIPRPRVNLILYHGVPPTSRRTRTAWHWAYCYVSLHPAGIPRGHAFDTASESELSQMLDTI